MTLRLIDGLELTRAYAIGIPKNARRKWFRSLRHYMIIRFLDAATMPATDLPDVLWAIDALQKELC